MPLSPMMQQYKKIKSAHEDAIVFFRLGDFYEMFYDDAITASRELELALTGRDCGESERAPMCGVPYHSADGYIARLIKKGYRVAMCEQMEPAGPGVSLVRRDVVRIITPGTVTDNAQLDESNNNYICSIYIQDGEISLCFADISTGAMQATTATGDNMWQHTMAQLAAYQPSEIISNIAIESSPIAGFVKEKLRALVSPPIIGYFGEDAYKKVTANLPEAAKLYPLESYTGAYTAAGALLSYLAVTLMEKQLNIKDLTIYTYSSHLEMDMTTRRSLELTENMRDGARRSSLLWVLDETCTAMGARLLKRCVTSPLKSIETINARLDAVQELHGDFMLREDLREQLSRILDVERLLTKVVYGSANARDLHAIATTLEASAKLISILEGVKSDELVKVMSADTLAELRETLMSAIVDTPPHSTREGGMVRDGYDSNVDTLRSIIKNSGDTISQLEAAERERTGIKNLKIGFNRVFGYYIEITKSGVHLAPEHYIRKQTLANAERYITPKLKELEDTILRAGDKLNALEGEIFASLCEIVTLQRGKLQDLAQHIATLDMYNSLAIVAAKHKYIRPTISEDGSLSIKSGRHAVVERFARESQFVPNDTKLDTEKQRFMLITGPNMAGKSTYMRQVALICVMAQVGSFVPADSAHICIIDKLFTRIGAADDLASGQSTFMMEMNEVAHILRSATKDSLIIYDEIGRGTSTYDGMSIARAVAEHTVTEVGAKTMFATHYHELTALEQELIGVKNYHTAAKKQDDTVVFLHKVEPGSADGSYGIEVAKLVGLPSSVISRARNVLEELEAQ